MIRGMIGPNGRPGYLVPYKGGVINLIEMRRFVVDERVHQVVDKKGEDLVLTHEVFDYVREAIAAGAPLRIEPLAGEESADGAELEGELRRAVAEIERLQALAAERAQQIAEMEKAREEGTKSIAGLQRENATLRAELDEARSRIGGLEAQLAAAAATEPAESAEPEAAEKRRKPR